MINFDLAGLLFIFLICCPLCSFPTAHPVWRWSRVAPDRRCNASASAGLLATLDEERTLDHGAWVPLRWMYPQADIPVLQLSLPDWPAAQQLALGQALRPLRQQGVLIIGSGSLTHNLHEFFQHYRHLPMQAGSEVYAEEFREWIMARLQARDVSALLDYRRQAPHAARAHPTEEHFMPLFVAWGACDVEVAQVERLNDEMSYRILALDAFAFNEGETV
jgi:4,5-DOPA dioxygenase extradiol